MLISGADSKSLCYNIQKIGNIKPIYVPNKKEIIDILAPILIGEIFLLVQGAGDIDKIAKYLAKNKFKKIKRI